MISASVIALYMKPMGRVAHRIHHTPTAKWQASKTERDIIRHQFGDKRPWSPYDRCQWCHCTLKSGYHEESCPVRPLLIEEIQNGKT